MSPDATVRKTTVSRPRKEARRRPLTASETEGICLLPGSPRPLTLRILNQTTTNAVIYRFTCRQAFSVFRECCNYWNTCIESLKVLLGQRQLDTGSAAPSSDGCRVVQKSQPSVYLQV